MGEGEEREETAEEREETAEEREKTAEEREEASEEREKTAEELEREENKAEPAPQLDTGAFDALERESEPLREGEAINLPFGPLPVRSVVAIGVMLLVAVVVYLVAWGLFGTLGLLLGWIPAVALGAYAGRELGRRAAS